MSSHANIVVSSRPNGRFFEGVAASGVTLSPGMCVQRDASGNFVLGRGVADGERGDLIIVCEGFTGETKTTAYAAAARVKLFTPAAGDKVQVLVADTEDAIAVTDKLIVDTSTGLFIETVGTPESEPFEALEALGTIAANTHCLAVATGN